MPRRWRSSAVGLLVFAFISLLGHVCVLPHVEVVDAAIPDRHHHQHDAAGSDGDDAHLGSCEAIRSTSTTPSVPNYSVSHGVLAGQPSVQVKVSYPEVAPPPPVNLSASPPPLYLLGAALLI